MNERVRLWMLSMPFSYRPARRRVHAKPTASGCPESDFTQSGRTLLDQVVRRDPNYRLIEREHQTRNGRQPRAAPHEHHRGEKTRILSHVSGSTPASKQPRYSEEDAPHPNGASQRPLKNIQGASVEAENLVPLEHAALLERCRVAVGSRLRMHFQKQGKYFMWEGTVRRAHSTFVSVQWCEYPNRTLFLPPPQSAGITILELQTVPYGTFLREFFPKMKEETKSLRTQMDRMLGHPESDRDRKDRQSSNEATDTRLSLFITTGKDRATTTARIAQDRAFDCTIDAGKTAEFHCTCIFDCFRCQPSEKPRLVSTPNPEGQKTHRVRGKVWHQRGMDPTLRHLEEASCDCGTVTVLTCNPRKGDDAVERIAKLLPRLNPAFLGKGEATIGGHDPWESVEPTFINTSSTTFIGWRKEHGTFARAPDLRVMRNAGVLGEITRNELNLEKILELDLSGEAAEVIDILLSASAFERHLKLGFRPQTRISRFMQQHTTTLKGSGVVEETPRDFGTNYMPVFTVPKKNGTLRLIQDGRHLNRWFDKPPTMNLPRIHDVIDLLMKNEYFAQCDAKSFFYQIPLHESIRKYFGTILGGGRGELDYTVMTKLPMGFSWAPCIAQRISNVIMRDIGLAWVDNYIVVGETIEEFEANRRVFLDRIHPDQCNVEVDDMELAPLQSGETLGIEVDLKRKMYRMSPKWAEKIRTIPVEWTPRTFSRIMGGIIWCSHVTRRGLCMQPHLMSVLGDIMRRIALKEVSWDERCDVTTQAIGELKNTIELMTANEWIMWREPRNPDVDIWSDASDTHAAYLICRNEKVIAALVRETQGHHIFLEELSIALDAVAAAYKLGATRVRLFCDNAAAAGCIEKNVSTNFTANTWLSQRAPVDVDVTWVSTLCELADPYTRGVLLPVVPSATCDLPVYETACQNSVLRAQGNHTFKQLRTMSL